MFYVPGMAVYKCVIINDRQLYRRSYRLIMANKTIKPNTRKEPLSKKKVVSIRKTTKSTKKLDAQLKVSSTSSSETTVDVSLKIRKSKVITFAEACFNCPSPKCNYVVSR